MFDVMNVKVKNTTQRFTLDLHLGLKTQTRFQSMAGRRIAFHNPMSPPNVQMSVAET